MTEVPGAFPTNNEFLADCRAVGPIDLRRRIGGIRTRVLSGTLCRLQYNGLVDRCTYREAPPPVEYRLT
ncbi:winged helix-turn-helix transcriptional regulator [Saccharopolyspora spinosa]|uniref:HxlR family transcriptional regulator n=1 Tax=Saccharopolyspora spinosa TaxID=60894 RepID=A0A2N3Y956_SACSN|nr:winged helix-turn-helix transcriptional regulator [Saccharopolyspora spinosa]PKW19469.1 HxlR family transcriptional regulator [Saccharopolyspora spinosa]